MASATRLPLKSILFTMVIVASAGASRVNLRNLLISAFTGPRNYSRIAAILIVLANLKNLPGTWHFRVWNGILKHCLFTIPNIPRDLAPSTIFLPVITTSHAPLMECDYNLHKSNSTYFSDLDVTRSHLVCVLLQPAIDKLQHNKREQLVLDPAGKPVLGVWSIMLGGVMCSFKREIGIYQPYEMWSRILCWDRKWIYIVTHFVKKETVKPKAYILTDGGWFSKGYKEVKGGSGDAEIDEKAIFASAVSKYVMKLGRLTIHPEIALASSGLLPAKPGGWASMNGRPSGESTPETLDAESNGESSDEWSWKRIEAENKRGLAYVEHFAALDGLQQEFTGSREPALGRYRDFIV